MFDFVGLPLDAITLETLLQASPSNVRVAEQPIDKATRNQLAKFYGKYFAVMVIWYSVDFALSQRHTMNSFRSCWDVRYHGSDTKKYAISGGVEGDMFDARAVRKTQKW